MSAIWTADEEASKLRKRFDALKASGGSQAEFARETEFPGGASMINQHLKGHRPINLRQATAYMRGFKCSIGEISPRLAQEVMTARAAEKPNAESGSNVIVSKFAERHAKWPLSNEVLTALRKASAEDILTCENHIRITLKMTPLMVEQGKRKAAHN